MTERWPALPIRVGARRVGRRKRLRQEVDTALSRGELVMGFDQRQCGCGNAVWMRKKAHGVIEIVREDRTLCEQHKGVGVMRIEIVQTSVEQPFHARIVGENHEKVWVTENYARRSDAIKAVALAAETFGIRGTWDVQGPPGNAMLAFSHSQIGNTIPSVVRFPLYDVDERTSGRVL